MKKSLLILLLLMGISVASFGYQGQWGTLGTGPGQFNLQDYLTLAPNGNVYVADRDNNRVQYFAPEGSYLGQWGTNGTGNGQFDKPEGITIGLNNCVYVVDSYNNRIEGFTLTGSYMGQIGSFGYGNGQFYLPKGIALAPSGKLYVADTGNDRIQYFGAANGSYLGQFSSTTTVPLNGPTGVATAPDGNVYVVDSLNFRVVYYTAEGICLGQFGALGSGPGQFRSATGICVDQNYIVYVTDWQSYPAMPRVQYFTATGSFIGSFGIENGPRGRAFPVGIVSVGNRLYVSDSSNCCILYYDNYLKTEPSSLGIIRSLYH